MNEKMLMKNGWMQKTIRIKLDYNKLCNFISFEEIDFEDVKNARKVYESIFTFSLDYVASSDDFLKYEIIKYSGRREPKGFLMKNETSDRLYKIYDIYKEKMKKKYNVFITFGEFIEFLMFYYCQNNIPKESLDYINNVWKINWGFRLEE